MVNYLIFLILPLEFLKQILIQQLSVHIKNLLILILLKVQSQVLLFIMMKEQVQQQQLIKQHGQLMVLETLLKQIIWKLYMIIMDLYQVILIQDK